SSAPLDGHRAGRYGLEAGDPTKRRPLAVAGGANQRQERGLLHLQAYLPHGVHGALGGVEDLGEVLDAQDVVLHAPGGSFLTIRTVRSSADLSPCDPLVEANAPIRWGSRSEEHTSELQSRENLVCRLLL